MTDTGESISVRVLRGSEAEAENLIESIIGLDRENMLAILDSVELDFPEEKRRRGLASKDKVIIAAFQGEDLVGYLDYGPSWDDPTDLFIGSLQIDPAYRERTVLGRLLGHAIADLENREFGRIVTGAQRTNAHAIALYGRLGFSQHPRSDESYLFVAGREVLVTAEAHRLKLRYAAATD